MSMNINFNTYIVKYYKGVVDNIKFIYDPDNVLSQNVWTFAYKDLYPAGYEGTPLITDEETAWEKQAKSRIERLVNAASSREAINEE